MFVILRIQGLPKKNDPASAAILIGAISLELEKNEYNVGLFFQRRGSVAVLGEAILIIAYAITS
jgi:hypothetical protein